MAEVAPGGAAVADEPQFPGAPEGPEQPAPDAPASEPPAAQPEAETPLDTAQPQEPPPSDSDEEEQTPEARLSRADRNRQEAEAGNWERIRAKDRERVAREMGLEGQYAQWVSTSTAASEQERQTLSERIAQQQAYEQYIRDQAWQEAYALGQQQALAQAQQQQEINRVVSEWSQLSEDEFGRLSRERPQEALLYMQYLEQQRQANDPVEVALKRQVAEQYWQTFQRPEIQSDPQLRDYFDPQKRDQYGNPINLLRYPQNSAGFQQAIAEMHHYINERAVQAQLQQRWAEFYAQNQKQLQEAARKEANADRLRSDLPTTQTPTGGTADSFMPPQEVLQRGGAALANWIKDNPEKHGQWKQAGRPGYIERAPHERPRR